MKFSDDNKQVSEQGDGNWLGFGVHVVALSGIEAGKTEAKGAEFVEFTVMGENGEEDTARVWFSTDKAANYSFNIMRQIYVHCAPEAKKDAARAEMDAVNDSDEAVALMQKCIGKKVWFTKYPNPTRTYVNQAGETKKSIDKNVLGYEPKLREDLMPKDNQKEALNALEGSEPATGNIPEEW